MTSERVAAFALFGGVATYFIGWAYLYTYYGALGIDVLEINPPLQVVLVYAFPAFWKILIVLSRPDWIVWTVGLVIAALCVTLAAESKIQRVAFGILVFSACVWMVGFVYAAARQAAFDAAWEKWMADSKVATIMGFDLQRGAGSRSDGFEITSYDRAYALRSIISTDRFHYLFTRDNCSLTSDGCPGLIFKIDRNSASYVVIEHGVMRR